MEDLHRLREAYLAGEEVSHLVRPVVQSAWRRCRAHGLVPNDIRRQMPDPDRLRELRREHRMLRENAEPLLRSVHEALAKQPHFVALAEPEGRILRLLTPVPPDGDTGIFFEGACWHERDIGCNGIGTALAENRPVLLIGPEHFSDAYVGWTCIGVPLHSEGGELLGAIDLSVPNEHVHTHTWGWMLSVAQGIESQLARSVAPSNVGDRLDPDELETPFHVVRGVLELIASEVQLAPTHATFIADAGERLDDAEAHLREAVAEVKASEQAIKEVNETLERRIADRTVALATANSKLEEEIEHRKLLEREVLKTAEAERRRIGQDLHDTLQGEIFAIGIMGSLLHQQLVEESSPHAGRARRITQMTDATVENTRRLARRISPVEVTPDGLPAALANLADNMETVFGIACTYTSDGTVAVPDGESATHLYRIAQEASHNAFKHARPDAISIELVRVGDQGVLRIRDDGRGISDDAANTTTSLGMQTMRYRADLIGGSLIVDTRPGDGTCVTCTFPLPPHGPAQPEGESAQSDEETGQHDEDAK